MIKFTIIMTLPQALNICSYVYMYIGEAILIPSFVET